MFTVPPEISFSFKLNSSVLCGILADYIKSETSNSGSAFSQNAFKIVHNDSRKELGSLSMSLSAPEDQTRVEDFDNLFDPLIFETLDNSLGCNFSNKFTRNNEVNCQMNTQSATMKPENDSMLGFESLANQDQNMENVLQKDGVNVSMSRFFLEGKGSVSNESHLNSFENSESSSLRFIAEQLENSERLSESNPYVVNNTRNQLDPNLSVPAVGQAEETIAPKSDKDVNIDSLLTFENRKFRCVKCNSNAKNLAFPCNKCNCFVKEKSFIEAKIFAMRSKIETTGNKNGVTKRKSAAKKSKIENEDNVDSTSSTNAEMLNSVEIEIPLPPNSEDFYRDVICNSTNTSVSPGEVYEDPSAGGKFFSKYGEKGVFVPKWEDNVAKGHILKLESGNFACAYCNYKSPIKRYITDHYNHVHRKLFVHCEKCDFITRTRHSLYRHYSNRHNLPINEAQSLTEKAIFTTEVSNGPLKTTVDSC